MASTSDSRCKPTIAGAISNQPTLSTVHTEQIGSASRYPPELGKASELLSQISDSIYNNKELNQRMVDRLKRMNETTKHSNNGNYEKTGLSRKYVSGASGEPPDKLDKFNDLLQLEYKLRKQRIDDFSNKLNESTQLRMKKIMAEPSSMVKQITQTLEQIQNDNNLWYRPQGTSKADVSCLSSYPPDYQAVNFVTPWDINEANDANYMIRNATWAAENDDDQREDEVESYLTQINIHSNQIRFHL